MKKGSVETMVGLFVLIGIICVGYLAIKLGKMEWIGDNYYPVRARFESVSGLNAGAEVEMAGVKIGKVESIALDTDLQVAIVKMRIRKGVELTDDVIAAIKTTGLIGDKYINLSPGGSDEILKPGDSIVETESAIDIETLVSKYIFGNAE